MTKEIMNNNSNDGNLNANNINRGKVIYLKNVLHYIVHEFNDNIIISKNEDLSQAYCVKKSKVSVKPTK